MLITIAATTVNPAETYTGTLVLRGWYSHSFIAGDAITLVEEGDGQNGFYYEVPTSVNGGGNLVIDEFIIQSTDDGNLPTARFTGQLFEDGAPREIIFGFPNVAQGWRIPILFGADVNLADLFRYNQTSNLLWPPPTYATYQQMIAEIDARAGQFDYARTNRLGLVKVSRTPLVESEPIAVEDTDPRVNSVFNAKYYGASGDGVTNDRTVLNTLVNTTMQALTGGGTVYFQKGDYLIGSPMTFPANVQLEFAKGARLKISTASLVTIVGSIDAGPFQIFTNANAGQGTIGFSGNHSLNLLYPEWWGSSADNSTDNFGPLQAAATAQKTLGGGFGGGVMQFSVGTYLTSAAIELTAVKGIIWRGSGRIGTLIKSTGSTAAVQGNGVWYSYFAHIQFASANALSNRAPIEIDGNYDFFNTQSTQANTFIDCLFDGSGSTYAITINRQGGNAAQGDHFEFFNCHWLRATEACLYQNGFNVLSTLIMGGDFQSYQKNGIKNEIGSINIYGTTFESTYGYTQIANGGWDVNESLGGAFARTQMFGVRSESLALYNGGNGQVRDIQALTQQPAGLQVWAATNGYSLDQYIIKASPNTRLNLYRVTTAGTSGGVEPTWPNSGTVADGGAVWTLVSYAAVNNPGGTLSNSTIAVNTVGAIIIGNAQLSAAQKTVAAAYTASNFTDQTIYVDTTSGAITISLPEPTSTEGKYYFIKKITTDANAVTVAAGANGIDGSATAVIPGGSAGFLIVECDTVNSVYRILSKSFGFDATTLNGATFAAPGTIGGGTPGAITGTTITANTGLVGPHNGTVGASTPAAGTFTAVTNSALTSGRVVVAGAAGVLADDADLTFATDTLTAAKVIAPTRLTSTLLFVQGEGSALTVGSNTIAPTNSIHQCGAGLIKTITVPSGFTSGTIALVPTAAYTYDATGNVLGTGTAVVGRTMFATFSSSTSKWSMSY